MVHKLSEIEHRASFGKEHLQGQVESSPSPAYLTSERESNDFGSWGGEVGWGGRALNLESSTNREIRPHLVEPGNCLVLSWQTMSA